MSLFATLNVSSSGLSAQRTRVEILAQNIANAQTTRTPEGGPYRRKHTVFESEPQLSTAFSTMLAGFHAALGPSSSPETTGVKVARVVRDNSAPERRYLPSHPDAGSDGYVEFPPFNPVEDMVDLGAGVRAYQANLAVIAAVKEMINRTIDISR